MGTGLGLASVFGIVKQNRGNIWVYSEPGHGATFKIYLPAQTALRADDNVPHPAASPYGTETVLVVDDDSRLRKIAQKGLQLFGYTVLVAADGAEALNVARSHSGPIHVLVTDVVMPGLPVRSVAQQIAEARPQIRVVYTSGYTTDAIVHHGILDQGIQFIQKPFAPETLATKIRETLDVR
jgi:CheY-like chemotaxis protein